MTLLEAYQAELRAVARKITDEIFRNCSGRCWNWELLQRRDDLLALIDAAKNH
jgi:hypothetical protein